MECPLNSTLPHETPLPLFSHFADRRFFPLILQLCVLFIPSRQRSEDKLSYELILNIQLGISDPLVAWKLYSCIYENRTNNKNPWLNAGTEHKRTNIFDQFEFTISVIAGKQHLFLIQMIKINERNLCYNIHIYFDIIIVQWIMWMPDITAPSFDRESTWWKKVVTKKKKSQQFRQRWPIFGVCGFISMFLFHLMSSLLSIPNI